MTVTLDLAVLTEARRDLLQLIHATFEFSEKVKRAQDIIAEGGDYPEGFLERLQKAIAEQEASFASISEFLDKEAVEILVGGMKGHCERMRSDYLRWTAVVDELSFFPDREFRMMN